MTEVRQPDGSSRTKTVVLAGFLGAGKTTLLKRILSWETDLSDTVVMVNEFGEVGIDGSLLQDAGSDVVELASGCVCCTLKADMVESLKGILSRFEPGRLLLEATGVADPEGVIEALTHPDLVHRLEIHKIVTVLDAEYWEARDVFGPLFFNQLRKADLILLNKVDLLESHKVPELLKEIHEMFPGCRVLPTVQCAVDPESLWNVSGTKEFGLRPDAFFRVIAPPAPGVGAQDPSMASRMPEAASERNSTSGFTAFSFSESRPLDEPCFRRFLEELPWEVFRIKGSVRFPDRTVMLNLVGGKGDWMDWKGSQETRLAFVSFKVGGEAFVQKLKACVFRS